MTSLLAREALGTAKKWENWKRCSQRGWNKYIASTAVWTIASKWLFIEENIWECLGSLATVNGGQRMGSDLWSASTDFNQLHQFTPTCYPALEQSGGKCFGVFLPNTCGCEAAVVVVQAQWAGNTQHAPPWALFGDMDAEPKASKPPCLGLMLRCDCSGWGTMG